MHEVQTNIDDFRHQINCFQAELQILDGRIKYNENALTAFKQEGFEAQKAKLDQLSHQIQGMEKKWGSLEQNRGAALTELEQLSAHAAETTAAFTQFKQRLEELEKELLAGQRRFEELGKLKGNLETLAKSMRPQGIAKTHKVAPGDSLKKIAKAHQTTVEKVKKLNGLESDRIDVGQELKLPTE